MISHGASSGASVPQRRPLNHENLAGSVAHLDDVLSKLDQLVVRINGKDKSSESVSSNLDKPSEDTSDLSLHDVLTFTPEKISFKANEMMERIADIEELLF